MKIPNPLKQHSAETISKVHKLRSEGLSVRRISSEVNISYRQTLRVLKMSRRNNFFNLVMYRKWS